jgi:hypothetical protein
MKRFLIVGLLCAEALSAYALATETVYVNTNGEVIQEAAIGQFCRPTEKLPDGRIMVFARNTADLALYRERLIANGVNNTVELEALVHAADADTCPRMAGNKCGDGKCATGSCKTTYTGGIASCSCQ